MDSVIKYRKLFVKFILTALGVLTLLIAMFAWVFWGQGAITLYPEGHDKLVSMFQELPVTRSEVIVQLSLSDMVDKYQIAKDWACDPENKEISIDNKIDCGQSLFSILQI